MSFCAAWTLKQFAVVLKPVALLTGHASPLLPSRGQEEPVELHEVISCWNLHPNRSPCFSTCTPGFQRSSSLAIIPTSSCPLPLPVSVHFAVLYCISTFISWGVVRILGWKTKPDSCDQSWNFTHSCSPEMQFCWSSRSLILCARARWFQSLQSVQMNALLYFSMICVYRPLILGSRRK